MLPSEADSLSAPLCVSARVALCTPASPTPSSQHPLVFPSSPFTALLFSPDWAALSFHLCALWTSVSLRQESINFSFFPKVKIENIVGFVCCLCYSYSPLPLWHKDRQRSDISQWLCSNKILFSEPGGVCSCPSGCGFLTLFMADMESSRRIEENNFLICYLLDYALYQWRVVFCCFFFSCLGRKFRIFSM